VLLRLGVCVTKRRGFYCKLKSIPITVRLDPKALPSLQPTSLPLRFEYKKSQQLKEKECLTSLSLLQIFINAITIINTQGRCVLLEFPTTATTTTITTNGSTSQSRYLHRTAQRE
jgi:hypothetical protein